MSYLVIGGTGHIGSYVVRRLVNEGLDVASFSRSGDSSRFMDIADKVKNLRGNIVDITDLLDVMKKYSVKYVVYCAAEHPWAWSPLSVIKNMILGFTNVLDACRLMDVEKVVWTSSYAQFGPPYLYNKQRVNEDDPVKPMVIHGNAYVINEFTTKFYKEQYNLDVLALRLGLVFGPGRGKRGFMDMLVSLFEDPLLGRPIKVPKAESVLTLQYVKEAANVVWFGLKAKGCRHYVYNTCDEAVSLRQLVEWIKELLPNAQIDLEPGSETPRVLVDADRIRKELGYRPMYTVKDGVIDYINCLKTQQFAK